jgi:NDP-mannose synthase
LRAIILAGGKGTRLRPYTTLIPKPLVPLGGQYSILEIIIKQLSNAGFNHITIAVNHLSHLIMSYFGDGSRLGVTIDYSVEDRELSTIGPLTLIENLPNDFLVMNGDILSDIDYSSFYKNHVSNNSLVSVASFKREVKIDFGVLEYSPANTLQGFREKPVYNFDVSMGIYCINRSVISELPKNKPLGFDDLMNDYLEKDKVINIFPFSGFWLDIGRPDDYELANEQYDGISKNLGIE